MFDVNVYYCWACDAHRRVADTASGAVCPRCGKHLPEDARLPVRIVRTSVQPTMVAPAPVRPRLAASA